MGESDDMCVLCRAVTERAPYFLHELPQGQTVNSRTERQAPEDGTFLAHLLSSVLHSLTHQVLHCPG